MKKATIKVELFGTLREKDSSVRTMLISEDETIRSVVSKLSIELHPWFLYSVNGQQAKADTQLHNGDILMIIPPISGG